MRGASDFFCARSWLFWFLHFLIREILAKREFAFAEFGTAGLGFLPNAAGVVARVRSWRGVPRKWRFGATRGGDRQTLLSEPVGWSAGAGVLCRNGLRE